VTEKGDSVEKSVEKFPAGVEKKKYNLIVKSVEKLPSQLNTSDLVDVRLHNIIWVTGDT